MSLLSRREAVTLSHFALSWLWGLAKQRSLSRKFPCCNTWKACNARFNVTFANTAAFPNTLKIPEPWSSLGSWGWSFGGQGSFWTCRGFRVCTSATSPMWVFVTWLSGTQSRSKGLTCCREKQKRQEGYILGPIHKARPSRSEFPSQTPLRDLCVDVLWQGRAHFWLVTILSKLTPQKKSWRPETLL